MASTERQGWETMDAKETVKGEEALGQVAGKEGRGMLVRSRVTREALETSQDGKVLRRGRRGQHGGSALREGAGRAAGRRETLLERLRTRGRRCHLRVFATGERTGMLETRLKTPNNAAFSCSQHAQRDPHGRRGRQQPEDAPL